jgi:hypothetical protein
LSINGGDYILAGTLDPHLAAGINQSVKVLELPWSAQQSSAVYESLKAYPPEVLIFSPDHKTAATVKGRNRLTYFTDRTWAVSFSGSFRIGVKSGLIHVDYMLEP